MVIAIYARKSVYRDTSDSISNQVDMCREFIERSFGTGHTILVYDKDEGISGATTSRPCFQKMMHDIKTELIDIVVCYMIDRISRNIKDFCNIYASFQEHDCRFVSVKENIDDTTPMGRAMLYICQVFANLERDNIRERIVDNMSHIEQLGYWASGTPPYGYEIIKINAHGKKHAILSVNPEKSKTYLRMVELFSLPGGTLYSVEKSLLLEGHHTDRGVKFDTSRIWKILSNPTYMCADQTAYNYFKKLGCQVLHDKDMFDGKHGIMIRGKFQQNGTRMTCRPTSEWRIYVGYHEPLISSKDWLNMQKRFKGNVYAKNKKAAIYGICSGVLYCKCGYTMRSKQQHYNSLEGRKTYSSYLCTRKDNKRGECDSHMIKCNVIDERVIAKLHELSIDKESLMNYINKDKVIPVFDIPSLQKKNKELGNTIQSLTLSLSDAKNSSARKYIIEEIERLDEEKTLITGKITEYKLQELQYQKESTNITELYENIRYLLDHLDSLALVEKNTLIKELVKKITVYDDSIEITF